jgi:hypothetical protein
MEKFPKHFECKICGHIVTIWRQWQGRPQGPKCTCDPDTWQKWKQVPQEMVLKKLEME